MPWPTCTEPSRRKLKSQGGCFTSWCAVVENLGCHFRQKLQIIHFQGFAEAASDPELARG